MSTDAIKEYGDIINLERPISTKHPPMSKTKRAAQFAPYAALTGYDYMLNETQTDDDNTLT